MVFGKSNDEAKLMVRNCGGIASLSHVLRLTDDQEMKELITGTSAFRSSLIKLPCHLARRQRRGPFSLVVKLPPVYHTQWKLYSL